MAAHKQRGLQKGLRPVQNDRAGPASGAFDW